eukprot:221481-Pelagomonas_calceolata.AAC.4
MKGPRGKPKRPSGFPQRCQRKLRIGSNGAPRRPGWPALELLGPGSWATGASCSNTCKTARAHGQQVVHL